MHNCPCTPQKSCSYGLELSKGIAKPITHQTSQSLLGLLSLLRSTKVRDQSNSANSFPPVIQTPPLGPHLNCHIFTQALMSILLGLSEQALNIPVLRVSPPDPIAQDDLSKLPSALSYFLLPKNYSDSQIPTG